MADVVIVGAGPAGLACALAVAERGGHAVLVEKAAQVGGALHVSAGQFAAAGTRRQRERGIDDDPARHLEEILAVSAGEVDPVLVSRAVHAAPAAVDWLEDIGLELDPKTPVIYHGHDAYAIPRTYWPAGGAAGRGLLEVLSRSLTFAVAAGKVELRLGHRVEDLLIDGRAVVGVRADGPDGEVELRGDAVVLTTGGYGADAELFAQLSPALPPLVSSCWPTSTGDGLRLSREVGAAMRGAEHQRQGIGSLETAPGSGRAGARVELNPHMRAPLELHVDASGRRFLAEDALGSHQREQAAMALPGQRFWVVFDEATLEWGSCLADLSPDDVRALAERGEVAWRANDLVTLAHCAGIDPAGLVETVTAWNALGPDGVDPLGRTPTMPALATPPYYAALVHATTVITFGGVTVDDQLRVVRDDGTPIAGLYAAGELLGAGALSGDRFWGGMALTPALALGREIGLALAA